MLGLSKSFTKRKIKKVEHKTKKSCIMEITIRLLKEIEFMLYHLIITKTKFSLEKLVDLQELIIKNVENIDGNTISHKKQ